MASLRADTQQAERGALNPKMFNSCLDGGKPSFEGSAVSNATGLGVPSSDLETDGRTLPYDIRMGVWVTAEGETEYLRPCIEEYNAHTDPSGRCFTLYKRCHLIGREMGLSVASVALRGEPTGAATGWNTDVVATAKRDLQAGEGLDGEGGWTAWGQLLPAAKSLQSGGLPLGPAHGIALLRPVREGQTLSWDDVAVDTRTEACRLRREMERRFSSTAG